MAQPTPADLLILAAIAEVLAGDSDDREERDLRSRALEWRYKARGAMRPAELRAELDASPAEGSAFVADLSAQTGSLEKAYRLLGSEVVAPPILAPALKGGEGEHLFEPPGDPRRWAR